MLRTNDSEIPPPEPKLGGDDVPNTSGRSSNVWWVILVALAAVLLCAPFFRVLPFLGDEGSLLHEAELILQGKRIYADFFQFLPPGAVVLDAAWFNMAGVSFGSARSLAVVTIVGIACFTFLACRQASRNATPSAILAIVWVMMSAWPWMQVSHHWFTTLLSMAAAWAAFVSLEQQERRLRWPLICGAAAGAAAMFVPHAGAFTTLAAMTAFVTLRQIRTELIAYVMGCAFAPAAVLAYLIGQHTLAPAFEDVIRFPAAHYSSVNIVPWGLSTEPLNRPLEFVFLFAAFMTVVVAAYDWRASLSDRRLRLCVAFAVAGFLSCYPRPDIIHISYSAPLTLPLLAYCMTKLTQSWRPVYRYAAAALLIGLCAPSAHHFEQLARRTLRTEVVSTPRGDVAPIGPYTGQQGVPELLTRIAAAPSGDAYFFYPYDAMLPFLSARENVSKYDLFTPWYTTPAQYEDACRSVVRKASWVVVDRTWTDRKNWNAIFPSMPEGMPQETIRFEQALDGAFDLVATDGAFETRRRRNGVSESVCDGIAEH